MPFLILWTIRRERATIRTFTNTFCVDFTRADRNSLAVLCDRWRPRQRTGRWAFQVFAFTFPRTGALLFGGQVWYGIRRLSQDIRKTISSGRMSACTDNLGGAVRWGLCKMATKHTALSPPRFFKGRFLMKEGKMKENWRAPRKLWKLVWSGFRTRNGNPSIRTDNVFLSLETTLLAAGSSPKIYEWPKGVSLIGQT